VKQLLARCNNWTTKKYYYTHCTTKNTQSFNCAWNFVRTKKQRKILLARGLSIQQLSALGRWNVTLLLLLLLWKKCEYHRTCCDYLVAAACQDGSARNERKKLQHFHQLVVNMVWDLWKSYARTFRCLALLRWERTSGKGAIRAIVGSNLCWSLLNSNSLLICIVGKQQKIHKPQSLNYCFFANQRVLFFAMRFLLLKGFALMGHLKTAMCECLRSRANRQVRIFLKHRRTYGSGIYLLLKIK